MAGVVAGVAEGVAGDEAEVAGAVGAAGLASVSTERLEAEAATLAGQVAALTCRWLAVVGELDRREAWREWGCTSMAHWLSWRCGVSLVTGREHVRVALALEGLPLVRERFAAGELSFSKVRALTRIVRIPEMEPVLVQFALDATAAQLDRVAAAYRTADRLADPDLVQRGFERRRMTRELGDDGTDTIVIRGPRDLVAEMWATFTAVMDAEVPVDEGDAIDQRRFDGVVAACRRLRQPDESRPPAVTVVLRVQGSDDGTIDASVPALLGGVPVGPAAVERLAGDALFAMERVLADGSVDRSKATPTIPRRVRRAVRDRDGRTCRWPSCTHRAHLHVHHIVWRSRGGTHEVGNLILLCSHHHSKVHLGGWVLEGDADDVRFVGPDGRRATNAIGVSPVRVSDAVDLLERDGVRIDEQTIATALGEPLDLHYAVGVFLDNEALIARRN